MAKLSNNPSYSADYLCMCHFLRNLEKMSWTFACMSKLSYLMYVYQVNKWIRNINETLVQGKLLHTNVHH